MDLSRLSKEEKLAYLDAIKEKKRRILAKKPTYKPNAGQLPVHLDKKSIRIVAAGNGGGKTALGAQEAIWWATGYNPITKEFNKVPATIVLLLDSPLKIDKIWLPELRKWYPLDEECELKKNGKPYVNEIVFKNGSVIQVMFQEQETIVFEGIQLDYFIADEPFERRIWVALRRGARKKGTKPRFLIIGTPIGQPWLYTDMWKKAVEGERTDIGLHRFSTDVNLSNLADNYKQEFGANLTEQEKAVRFDGQFDHIEGLALAHLFRREVHVVPPFPWPQGKPVVLIIDPHWSKPHTFALVGATGDGRIYYIKEGRSRSPAAKFAEELREFYKGYRVIDYVIDSLASTPNTGGDGNKSFAEKLNERGVPVRATSFADKNDEDFIQKIQQVLEIPTEADNFGRKLAKLAIVEGNQGLINDIETVQWQKYRNNEIFKNKLDISQKDYLSLLKYALATNIAFIADIGKLPKVKRSRRSPWAGGRR